MQRAAITRRCAFNEENITHAINALQNDANTLAALNAVADAGDNVNDIRTRLHNNRQNLGNLGGVVGLDQHLNDDLVLTEVQAQAVQRAARKKLNALLIINTITTLDNNDSNEAILTALTKVINATDANPTAIRRALQDNATLRGTVDLTSNIDNESVLRNADTALIHQAAVDKRNAIINQIQDPSRKNQLTIEYALQAIVDHANPALTALADTADIRATIEAKKQSLNVPEVDFTQAANLADTALQPLQTVAINQRSKLRKNHIEGIITQLTSADDNKALLLKLINTPPGADAIRKALEDNKGRLGNITITTKNHLTDEDALALRAAANRKYHALTNQPAPSSEITIPGRSTQEHTDLMNHIDRNLYTYTSRILRLEETRKLYRHSTNDKMKTTLGEIFSSCKQMREQLIAYANHLKETYAINRTKEQEENLQITLTNIERLNKTIDKIDQKFNKATTAVYHFSDKASVVKADENITLENAIQTKVNEYLQGNNGANQLVGSIHNGKEATRTKTFDNNNEARVNCITAKGKDGNGVPLVTVQKPGRSDFYFGDIAKIDTSRKFLSPIPNDEVMRWAIAQIAAFEATNNRPGKPIQITQGTGADKIPEEFVKALALYLEYRGIPYTNATSYKISAINKEQESALTERFKKHGDYLTNGKKELSHSVITKIQERRVTETEVDPIIKPPRGP